MEGFYCHQRLYTKIYRSHPGSAGNTLNLWSPNPIFINTLDSETIFINYNAIGTLNETSFNNNKN